MTLVRTSSFTLRTAVAVAFVAILLAGPVAQAHETGTLEAEGWSPATTACTASAGLTGPVDVADASGGAAFLLPASGCAGLSADIRPGEQIYSVTYFADETNVTEVCGHFEFYVSFVEIGQSESVCSAPGAWVTTAVSGSAVFTGRTLAIWRVDGDTPTTADAYLDFVGIGSVL